MWSAWKCEYTRWLTVDGVPVLAVTCLMARSRLSGVLELAVRARRLSANPAANVELPQSLPHRRSGRADGRGRARPAIDTPSAGIERVIRAVPPGRVRARIRRAALVGGCGATHSLSRPGQGPDHCCRGGRRNRPHRAGVGHPKESRGTMGSYSAVPSERTPRTH